MWTPCGSSSSQIAISIVHHFVFTTDNNTSKIKDTSVLFKHDDTMNELKFCVLWSLVTLSIISNRVSALYLQRLIPWGLSDFALLGFCLACVDELLWWCPYPLTLSIFLCHIHFLDCYQLADISYYEALWHKNDHTLRNTEDINFFLFPKLRKEERCPPYWIFMTTPPKLLLKIETYEMKYWLNIDDFTVYDHEANWLSLYIFLPYDYYSDYY